MVGIPVAVNWNFDDVEGLFGNFGKPVDGIYEGPAIANITTVVVADSDAVSGSTLDGFQVTDADSVAKYGNQAGRALVTILATGSDAQSLAEYLQRPAPDYWFSDIEVPFIRLSSGQRDAVAALEIGDYIRVSKRFPNVTNPVIEDLSVEGIDHQITPSGHIVRIYTSPVVKVTVLVLDSVTDGILDVNVLG
jgi:hypothetical protein